MSTTPETRTQLHEIREQRRISAAQIAKVTGVSRQTIYAIEAGEYVPNTTLALQLARILEVRVEDLFRLEAEPTTPSPPVTVDLIGGTEIPRKGQPVRLCRVGKQVIGVPAIPPPAMLPMADGVIVENSRNARTADVHVFQSDPDEGRRLLIAGCDPGISLLVQHLARYENVDAVVAQSSSQQALDWLRQGKVHVAGSHLRDLPTGEFNLPHIRRMFPKSDVKVVTFAIWEQGLVVGPGNPKHIRGVADLARKDVSMVNREKGAGSRDLIDQELREARISTNRVRGYDRIADGHLPAALAVSMHEADCCIATRSAARAFGLSFLPLATERYDLVVRRQHVRLPAVEALLDVLNRSAVRRKLEALAGYDTSHTGEVLVA
jgi:molybdopterin molybdotransferase/putative molybdopterin biosynthesis protein